MKPTNRNHTNRARWGFALVVTLSLMILLTMVAVGLLTLSAVSLRASSQGQAAAEARANARLALMMAIGELQKEMGPDSRISAPHDAGSAATGGQPRWTAVYDAWKYEAPGTPETPDSRKPKFRGWLVSGANQATGGPAGTSELATLVGPGSLAGSTTADEQVKVPMHALNSGNQRGRLAWWTADEGMKARINAGPDDAANTSVASNPLFQSQSPPHVDQRQIPKLENFTWKPGQRAKAISTAEVDLAAGLTANAGLGNLNHNLTVHSAGVLADVRGGHLKRDLTNLLTRPIEEVEEKPLYLANGRMNRFEISEAGVLSNALNWPATAPGSDCWGINLEELHLFHNIYQDLQWNGSTPSLVMAGNVTTAVSDRYFPYKRPSIDAMHIIMSLKAVKQGSATPQRYQMRVYMDGMLALYNPNDVTLTYDQGLAFHTNFTRIPYRIQANINGIADTTPSTQGNFRMFAAYPGGGYGGNAITRTLVPGESAVFGTSTPGSGAQLNLYRGFVPSGGIPVDFNDFNPQASNLLSGDNVELLLNFDTTGYTKNGRKVFTGCTLYFEKGNNDAWFSNLASLEAVSNDTSALSPYLPTQVQQSQNLTVADYIAKPLPVLALSFMRNVERDSGGSVPTAIASRPFLMMEPGYGISGATHATDTFNADMHKHQLLMIAEPMNYEFSNSQVFSPTGSSGGKNIYHGGGRDPGLGGAYHVIRRRIPLAPPISLGAFENAIACGFTSRFGSMKDFPASAKGFNGFTYAPPLAAKAIGNSFSSPFLPSGVVYQDPSGTDGGTDHSWMVNNALWDSWFLSNIVDGSNSGNPFFNDPRKPRAQFEELAKGTGTLRNTRYQFHAHRSADDALDDLFSGDNLKPSAVNGLAKYLLVDGAFNVNSTSENAWQALLASVRDQELLVANGAKKKFNHPYGTLGYAHDTSTSNDWTGLRDLSDTDITNLAKAIVAEVKARGPFLSLADFINRRPNSSDPTQQALGALQTAIDKSGLNNRFTGNGRSVEAADFTALPGGAVAKEPAPARVAGAAGHLTQARLLTALGPQITVRADTFLIRTYGDTRDSSGTKILARAWCEAVVQRVPEYVDASDAPEVYEGWPDAGDTLAPANAVFGRRMQIKSFRWLSRDEIGDV